MADKGRGPQRAAVVARAWAMTWVRLAGTKVTFFIFGISGYHSTLPVVYEPQVRRRQRIGDLFAGVGYLGRGLGWVARHPGQWLFGLIPAVITLILVGVALFFLGTYADDLGEWVTPFADGWSPGLRDAVRLVAALAIFGTGAFLALVLFTALTLLIGGPFYESIAVRVEQSQGGAPPEPDAPLLVQLARGVKDSSVVGVLALVLGVLFFVLGFIPLLGQTVVPVVAACVTGFFLSGELTAIALERRGLRRKARFALLRQRWLLAVGFGAATVVVFLIPFGAVLAMPGAVAGGTLLARERLAPGADASAMPTGHHGTNHPR